MSTTSWLTSLWGIEWHQLLLPAAIWKWKNAGSAPTRRDIQALLKYPSKAFLLIRVIYSLSISLSPWMFIFILCMLTLYSSPSCICLLMLIPLSYHFHITHNHPSRSAQALFHSLSHKAVLRDHCRPAWCTVNSLCQGPFLPFHYSTFVFASLFFLIGSGLQAFICSNTQRAKATSKLAARSISRLLVELGWRAPGSRLGKAKKLLVTLSLPFSPAVIKGDTVFWFCF